MTIPKWVRTCDLRFQRAYSMPVTSFDNQSIKLHLFSYRLLDLIPKVFPLLLLVLSSVGMRQTETNLEKTTTHS